MSELPPSLAVAPNIPHYEQTLEQLCAERDYWQAKMDRYTSWGAGLEFAASQLSICERMIARREEEARK